MNLRSIVAAIVLTAFLIMGPNTWVVSCNNKLTDLIGWRFYTNSGENNMMSSSSSDRIYVASLLDGTLLAIDVDSGSILWSINEEDSSFLDISQSINLKEQKTIYLPSSSGNLYRVKNNAAQLVSHDQAGRTNFNKNFYILSSKQDVITIGIDLLSGKLYYYCSSVSCYKNTSSSLIEYNTLLIIKRTLTVSQMIDVSSGDEIIRYIYGKHEPYLYNTVSDEILNEKINDTQYAKGLNYDINLNILYGFSMPTDELLMNNCWKIQLPSPLLSSWVAKKDDKLYILAPIKLSSLISIDIDGSYTLNQFVLRRINGEGVEGKSICYDTMFLNTYDQLPFLQAIDYSSSSQSCRLAKIYAFNNLRHSLSPDLTDGLLNYDQLNEAISKITKTRHKVHFDRKPSMDVRILKLKVSWRRVSIQNLNALKDFSEKEQLGNYDVVREIVFVVSIFTFWKEIIATSFIISVLLYLIIKYYKKYRDRNKPTTPVNPEPHITNVKFKTTVINVAIMPLLKIDEEPKVSEDDHGLLPVPSRYETDFIHLDTIGSGGFGVVFKAKNAVDDCIYAVKKITLPNCVSAKNRVMREVKALAKLSHSGIVRFYNAWFEDAPISRMNTESYDEDEQSSDQLSSSTSPIDSLDKLDTSPLQSKSEVNSPVEFLREDSQKEFLMTFEDEEDKSADKLWDSKDDEISSSTECDMEEIHDGRKGVDFSFIANCDDSENCSHNKIIYLYIQMQLCHKRTLKSWLLNGNRNLHESISIFSQIISAIQFVHSQGLIHRDMKPSNIFFAFDGTVKIGDFGLVTRITGPIPNGGGGTSTHVDSSSNPSFAEPSPYTKYVGTKLYMSPEQLANKPYSYKIDIYSLGLILFELVVPYSTQHERVYLLTDAKKHIFPEDCQSLTPSIINLIKWMLAEEASDRPSAGEIIKNSLMKDILDCTEMSSSAITA